MSSIQAIVPVLPSADIERDVKWYKEKAGFENRWNDSMYAILQRDQFYVHLQWHADTPDDPLNGGSVIRIFVNAIDPVFEEFVNRGTVNTDQLRRNTDWGTHEFGFFDLNKNAIFVVQDASEG